MCKTFLITEKGEYHRTFNDMTPHKMNVLINSEHFSTIFSSAKSDSKVTIFVMASHSNVQDRNRMPLFEALIMATFSILLPSWDAFSDVYFACNLIAKGHPIFGFTILYPVFLATFFILPHWWRKETTLKSRLLTIPLVITQLWSQYRIMRILHFGLWYQTRNWRLEKELHFKAIDSLGSYSKIFRIVFKSL